MSSLLFQLAGVAAPASNAYLENITLLFETLSSTSLTQLKASTSDENEKLEVQQWVVYAQSAFDNAALEKLNGHLASRSYFVGQFFTVADIAVFAKLVEDKKNDSSLSTFNNLARWYDHVQYNVVAGVVPIQTSQKAALVLPFLEAAVAAAAASAAATTTTEPAPAAAKTEDKKEKETKGKKEGKDTKKEEKKEAAPAAASEAAPSSSSAAANSTDGLDPSKLEIKVGEIKKCWNHPESDKLLCEEIDVGEGSVRTIASGLRAHYTAEEMVGKKVLVLANLKERPMAGFKSQGMVLCAVGEGHSVVKLLVPPAVANVGDRVDIAGFSGEPAQPSHVAKKKIFESLAPFFRTNATGVPTWNNIPFTIKGEECAAVLPDVVVS